MDQVVGFPYLAQPGLVGWQNPSDVQAKKCAWQNDSMDRLFSRLQVNRRKQTQPQERWISGFLSRWRKGCPSHCSNWTNGEATWHLQLASSLHDSGSAAVILEAVAFVHYFSLLNHMRNELFINYLFKSIIYHLPRRVRHTSLRIRAAD